MDILRAETYKPAHSYNSSESSAYDRVNSLTRSESGTSQTHYDDIGQLPSPKVHMNDYGHDTFDLGSPDLPAETAHIPQPQIFNAASDPMAMHMLLDTALGDCKSFEILSPEQLDALKKDQAAMGRKIETAERNLKLEIKVRNAAQSVNRLGAKGSRDSADAKELADSIRKCEELSQTLLRLEKEQHQLRERHLKHTAAVFHLDRQEQKAQAANGNKGSARDSNDWGAGFGFGAGALANTADGIMDLDFDDDGPTPAAQTKLRGLSDSMAKLLESTGQLIPQPEENATMDQELDFLQSGLHHIEEWHNETGRLWDVIGSGEEDMRHRRLQSSRAMDDDDDLEDDDPINNEQFSHQAFAAKVERLCNRAALLHGKLDGERSTRDQLQQQLQEKAGLDSEVARLTTEVTMARAELEGAYGSRAERAAEASKPELEQLTLNNTQLSQELSELVAEHEALVRQGVEAERDRETLETSVDTLREKTEALELRLNEERLGTMAAPSTTKDGAREATSMGVMRTEFKKLMREARAEHFRHLRAEQEERRRLEALIRTLRKDQGQPLASPATLSPQTMLKSKLGRTVTAS